MEIYKLKPIDGSIDTSNIDVGVIVGRFQTPYLHEKHRELIEYVISKHNSVIIFLGVSRVTQTEKNPLDFLTRKIMIEQHYCNDNIVILPQLDERYDDIWSNKLDTQISNAFGNSSAVLYGGRDSFIPYYEGKYETIELSGTRTKAISATEIRLETSKTRITSLSGREGVIKANFGRYAKPNPTVDVIGWTREGKILMGRKQNEPKFRFIGGYVDTTDDSLEDAALREFKEETKCDLKSLTFLGSTKIDDWRYRGERDTIMTSLFCGEIWDIKKLEASDDIVECKLFDFDMLSEDTIMEEHIPLLKIIKNNIYFKEPFFNKK
tara:strand:+ start:8512 stop:9477 length:966 start_codon:yes stop_codon:yes gene_type:complete